MKFLTLIGLSVLLYSCSRIEGNTRSFEMLEPRSIEQLEGSGEQVPEFTEKGYQNEEFDYNCAFIPSYRFLKDQDLSDSDLVAVQKEYAKNSSFLLELKVKKFNDEMLKYKITGSDDYYQRIEYFSFQAQKDLRLICGQDTLLCANHHYERTYGMAPTIRLSLRFPISEEKLAAQDKITVEFFDRVFGQGIVNFQIDPKQIKRYRIVNTRNHEDN